MITCDIIVNGELKGTLNFNEIPKVGEFICFKDIPNMIQVLKVIHYFSKSKDKDEFTDESKIKLICG